MKDNKTDLDQKRRALIATSLASGSLLINYTTDGQWAKPVVNAVLLPAHAETSPPGDGCSASATSPAVFAYTGGSQTFVVPSGVTSLNITAIGGGGGGGGGGYFGTYSAGDDSGGTGSIGQTVPTAMVAVLPCEELRVIVAGGGTGGSNGSYGCYYNANLCTEGKGGYGNGVDGTRGNFYIAGGGGDAAGSGGGSGGISSVYRGGTPLAQGPGGTGGGGGTSAGGSTPSAATGGDGSAGGLGGYVDKYYQAGDGGAGFNGPNGAGAGGRRYASDSMSGAHGSVVISF